MPSGNKIALAKRANSTVVTTLMERSDKKVIASCLESPVLTEGHLWKLISKPSTKPLLIKMIAEHPKWSLRYSIKYALIRNFHAPMTQVAEFIKGMKSPDLRDLYSDRNLPSATRPFIYRELLDRGESLKEPPEETYELYDDEDSGLQNMTEPKTEY
jgi:hypothetical protein